jgi:hypothetical protein
LVGGSKVGISDAKPFIGKVCTVCWTDRSGAVQEVVSKIHDVTYVPLYGGYLITDLDDIPLDKLTVLTACGEAVEKPIAA